MFRIVGRCGVALCAAALLAGCEATPQTTGPAATTSGTTQPAQPSGAPIGEVKSTSKVGPSKLSLDQVQAEVEAYADKYVLAISQATDEATRANPEMRESLHAVKLAVGRGAYMIAAGPNPVVSVLDLIVQATLVRNSVEKNLATRLTEESGAAILNTFTRMQDEAWALGARALQEQDLTDLRMLIDTWIQENPNMVYVAGIRFSDFSRLRPKEGTSLPSNIFSFLRINPLSSLDPAAREIAETRELAEHVFYYLQRMPQLVRWQTEGLYYQLASAKETQDVLQKLDEVAKLPETIPATLKQSEESVRLMLDDANATLAVTQDTLDRIKATSTDLESLGVTATETGRAWQETANAFTEMANAFNPPDDPNAPPSEPVSVHDYINGLKEAQATASELRQLLNELNATVQSGAIEASVANSVAETRRGAERLTITITICAASLVAFIVIGAIVYRIIAYRIAHSQPASGGVAHSDNE